MGRIGELRRSSPLALLVGLAAASVGVIYGYDLSNIAGALLFIEADLGLTAGQQEMVATATVIGEIAGAAAGGWLANTIGRKNSMVAVAITYAAFALLGEPST
jgi:MFS family permease